jgi:hypothetical protein
MVLDGSTPAEDELHALSRLARRLQIDPLHLSAQ